MPQTLLGFLGILLASFLSLNQLQSGIKTDEQLNGAEVQALAAEVAMRHLETLDRMPFDEAVVDAYITSPVELTPSQNDKFVRIGTDPAGNDLDDAHRSTLVSSHVLREGEPSFQLQSDIRVVYVSEADGETESLGQTRFKRVEVVVTALDSSADPISVSQLYSCGSYCSW